MILQYDLILRHTITVTSFEIETLCKLNTLTIRRFNYFLSDSEGVREPLRTVGVERHYDLRIYRFDDSSEISRGRMSRHLKGLLLSIFDT